MADFVFEDPFNDSIEDIRASLFDQVDILWPDAENRPDVREGSLMWTLLSPIAFEIQRFQSDLNLALELSFLQFTFGEFLDLKGLELGLERKDGSNAVGTLRFLGSDGVIVPTGTTASNVLETSEDEQFLYDTTEVGTIEGVDNPSDIDEVQKITVSGIDRFTITFDGDTTTPLDATDTGATIATAIEALAPTANYTTIDVTGDSGVANSDGASITFDGGDVDGTDVPLMVVNPYKVHEEQSLVISGTGTFEITFDGAETAASLTETSTATAVVNAINTLSPATTYGAFTVSTSSPGATTVTSGVTIVFDGGGVQYTDVPNIQITSKTGTISETVTETVTGEDSSITAVVEEVSKGREASPVLITADQNEIQRLSFSDASMSIENVISGEEGPNNEIQKITSPNAPLSGSFTLTFDDGATTDTTAAINFDEGAAEIQAALEGLTNIDAGDVEVLLSAGGPNFDDSIGTAFTVEFKNGLRYESYGLLLVDNITGDFSGAGQPIITRVTSGSNGVNARQKLEYTGSVPPSGGEISITIEDEDGSGSETLANVPYNVTAGDLMASLEGLSTYANGTDPAGTNFFITGGPLNEGPLYIEFTGVNRYKPFKLISVSLNTTGVPSSGSFTLDFNDSFTIASSGSINYDDTTQDVTTALESASNIGSGDVLVTIANNVHTLAFSGGPPTLGSFDLTVDDGAGSDTTGLINYAASASTVESELESLSTVGLGNVVVESSGGTLDGGATYTIIFLDPTVTYKTITSTNTLDGGTSVVHGPTLADAGTAYQIEFVSSLAGVNYSPLEYDEGTSTLSPEPSKATIFTRQDGGVGVNETQLLTLSHPAAFFTLGFGATSPTETSIISTDLDTASIIKNKLEALGDIGSGNLTAAGGPLAISDVTIEFSGGAVAATDQPLITKPKSLISGGEILGPSEDQPGFDSSGPITGNVRYAYTLVTKLGVQESTDDVDYESGFGETGPSDLSTVETVANKNVLVKIDPVVSDEGLRRIKKLNIHRSLNGGPYRLVGTISESNIKFATLGTSGTLPMYFADTISAPNFAAITTTMNNSNTTGVVDVSAEAQEVLDSSGNRVGAAQNLPARSIEVLEDNVVGVTRVTNPEPFGGGSDVESDDDYRQRLLEEAQKDPGAGNIDDYIGWAKEVDGIDSVAVIPEWQEIYGPLEGPGTVKVIVAGDNSTVVTDEKIEEVRQYITGTIAIPDPDQLAGPAASPEAGGSIEDGIYEYVYTFINVGKGETAPSPAGTAVVSSPKNSVRVYLEKGQSGIGVQNTIGRRIYRRKIDGALTGEPDSENFVLVTEILDNTTTNYLDTADYDSLPTWVGYPDGPYQRRKAPVTNSTSLFDGLAPIGAHITVESITNETIWVNATIFPETGYSLGGVGGTIDLELELEQLLQDFFSSLPNGQDVLIKQVENVLHDYAGVKDFKDVVLYSPAFPTGTTTNIPIGDGVSAQYSSAGTFSLWTSYPYDK